MASGSNVALLARLEIKPGKEEEVMTFMKNGISLVEAEPATTTWLAFRIGKSTFGIVDTFPNDAGRKTHLSSPFANQLMAKFDAWLAKPPVIEELDVLALKLPK